MKHYQYSSFRQKYGPQYRKAQAQEIISKNSQNNIPVVFEKAHTLSFKQPFKNYLYTAQKKDTFQKVTLKCFNLVIENHPQLNGFQYSNFKFSINNFIPHKLKTMQQLYKEFKQKDEFIYIKFTIQAQILVSSDQQNTQIKQNIKKYVKYKQKYSLQERKEKFEKNYKGHQNMILLIIQKSQALSLDRQINYQKFMIQKTQSFKTFKKYLIKSLKSKIKSFQNLKNQTFSVKFEQFQPDDQETMEKIYETYKNCDGFLYASYDLVKQQQKQNNTKIEQKNDKKIKQKIRFKQRNSFEQRKKQSQMLLTKNPTSIPIILQRQNQSQIQEKKFKQNKFLCNKFLKIYQFKFSVLTRLKQNFSQLAQQSIQNFVLKIGSSIQNNQKTFEEFYKQFKDDDGFLYLTYDFRTPQEKAFIRSCYQIEQNNNFKYEEIKQISERNQEFIQEQLQRNIYTDLNWQKNMICPYNRQKACQLLCCDKYCQKNAFICESQKCQCFEDHKKCKVSTANKFILRLKQKIQKVPGLIIKQYCKQVLNTYFYMINKISQQKQEFQKWYNSDSEQNESLNIYGLDKRFQKVFCYGNRISFQNLIDNQHQKCCCDVLRLCKKDYQNEKQLDEYYKKVINNYGVIIDGLENSMQKIYQLKCLHNLNVTQYKIVNFLINKQKQLKNDHSNYIAPTGKMFQQAGKFKDATLSEQRAKIIYNVQKFKNKFKSQIRSFFTFNIMGSATHVQNKLFSTQNHNFKTNNQQQLKYCLKILQRQLSPSIEELLSKKYLQIQSKGLLNDLNHFLYISAKQMIKNYQMKQFSSKTIKIQRINKFQDYYFNYQIIKQQQNIQINIFSQQNQFPQLFQFNLPKSIQYQEIFFYPGLDQKAQLFLSQKQKQSIFYSYRKFQCKSRTPLSLCVASINFVWEDFYNLPKHIHFIINQQFLIYYSEANLFEIDEKKQQISYNKIVNYKANNIQPFLQIPKNKSLNRLIKIKLFNFKQIAKIDLLLIKTINLKILEIDSCQDLKDYIIQIVSQKSKYLEQLQVVNCSSITGKYLKKLNNLTKLEIIKSQGIKSSQIIAAASKMSKLSYLNLSENQWVDDNFLELITQFCQNLKVFHIQHSKITSKGFKQIKKMRHLVDLNCGFTKITGTDLIQISNQCFKLEKLGISKIVIEEHEIFRIGLNFPFLHYIKADQNDLISNYLLMLKLIKAVQYQSRSMAVLYDEKASKSTKYQLYMDIK